MKKLMALGLTLLSLNAFSQSYLVLYNGVTLTTDKAGYVYDFEQFLLPYEVEVKGGRFLIADKELMTIDKDGYFYNKKLEVKDVKGHGLNYFIAPMGEIYTIDDKGFYFRYEDNSVKSAVNFGGNFFTTSVRTGIFRKRIELYVVTDAGTYFKVEVEGLNPGSISEFGGNFFQTNEGMIYTVSKDGLVFSKPDNKVESFKYKGGNFFIDQENTLYTVTEEGYLLKPLLPANLKLDGNLKVGANYLIDEDGKFFGIDTAGNVYERSLSNHEGAEIRIHSY